MTTTTTPPKKFINDPSEAVSEMIQGLLYQYPNTLRKLSNHNVLLSADLTHDKVNILSGGGSGHEPSHAGWIGSGMLSGAVLGGMFASPSVASVLAAIRAVTSPNNNNGCLLIVKNYTGDRLNFGQACELANAEGRKTLMVVVADDCALPRAKGIVGARGVAGTVLVHKAAGAAAADGKSLEEVANIARMVSSNIGTLGVALDAVTVPGASSLNDRLDAKTIEIGLGIHGEAGIRTSPLLSCDELAATMIDTIRNYGLTAADDKSGTATVIPTYQKGDNLVVLVNNLGGTSNFEMSILANSVVNYLEGSNANCSVRRLYVGSFMTSFDMRGASVSILSLSNATTTTMDIASLLDSTTDAPAWSKVDVWAEGSGVRPSSIEIPEIESTTSSTTADVVVPKSTVSIPNFVSRTEAAITAACRALIENEALLTKYDTIVGDGDCGQTMERGAKEILSRLEKEDGNALKIADTHPSVFLSSMADAISASMGGTSGVLLELMFRKMGNHLLQLSKPTIEADDIAHAFSEGVKVVSLYGGASLGSSTMLDALIPAVQALVSSSNSVEAAAEAAEHGAETTAAMGTATAGRSSYLREESLQGTPDPGAVAVSIVFKAITKAV